MVASHSTKDSITVISTLRFQPTYPISFMIGWVSLSYIKLHHNHRLKNIQNWISYLWNYGADVVLGILPFAREMFWWDLVVFKGVGHAIKTNLSCEPSFVTYFEDVVIFYGDLNFEKIERCHMLQIWTWHSWPFDETQTQDIVGPLTRLKCDYVDSVRYI